MTLVWIGLAVFALYVVLHVFAAWQVARGQERRAEFYRQIYRR